MSSTTAAAIVCSTNQRKHVSLEQQQRAISCVFDKKSGPVRLRHRFCALYTKQNAAVRTAYGKATPPPTPPES